ncbi:DUF2460 domain-containing protein [Anianabacter salinae]|uniref:DUF2460 domain-containing protein n=1 Tax=Anianabacter salinae TaxID=2851023 RepID=UPI00225E09E6|nr:DUF2460 domain-containing protein [Anianabacter salinae]MBV0912950.1 DUF2460 domain-containing protein [Anianabacter salinae]
MAFHEVRFPANLSFGSTGGPERRTEIVTLANGFEERNTPWAHSRRRYDAGVAMRSLDDLEALIAFFEARGGRLHGFRWKDWSDYKSGPASRAVGAFDQRIGTGDGETLRFALVKTYVSGGVSYERPILKPVDGSLRIGVHDQELPPDAFAFDALTGEVVLDEPPDVGVAVTAGFEFDVPVRFDTDLIQTSVASFQAGDTPNVPIVEVRL